LNSFIAAANSQKQMASNATIKSINPNVLQTLSKNNTSYTNGLNMSTATNSGNTNSSAFNTNINNNIGYFNGNNNNNNSSGNDNNCQFRNAGQLDQQRSNYYELMSNSSNNSNVNKLTNTNIDTRYNLDQTQASSKSHQSQLTSQFSQNSNCYPYQQQQFQHHNHNHTHNHQHHHQHPQHLQQQQQQQHGHYTDSRRTTHADLIKDINSHLNISCNSSSTKAKAPTPPSSIYSPKFSANYTTSSSLFMLHTAAMGVCANNSHMQQQQQANASIAAANEAAASMLKLSNGSLNSAMEISAPSSLINASNASVYINAAAAAAAHNGTTNNGKQKSQAPIINAKNNDGLLFKLINKIYNVPTLIKK
jgi:hypothetical protein